MKKFNKNLTIHIVQESTNSPSICQESQDITVTESRRRTDHQDSDDDRFKTEHNQKLNVVEFEEFEPEEILRKEDRPDIFRKHEQEAERVKDNAVKKCIGERNLLKSKKEYSIEIPEIKNISNKSLNTHLQSKTFSHAINDFQEKEDFKEPPAPSNKQSNKNKSFVFPTNQPKMPLKVITQMKKSSREDEEYEAKIDEMIRSFDRERQEFYKQKSKYEKDLMVKDGQIEMLQRIITNKISSQDQLFHLSNYSRDQDKQYESLILEKDIEITELLEKINSLNHSLEEKNEEINQTRSNCSKLENLAESLKNQIYIYEKKEANQKITNKFYLLKNQRPPSNSKTWKDDSCWKKEELKYTGIEDIHKRLQNLKVNRMELEDRKKIKSEIAYSQTTKYKNRTTFDFKGVLYDREREREREYGRVNKC